MPRRTRSATVGLTAIALALLPVMPAAAHPPGPPQPLGGGSPKTSGAELVAHVNPGTGTNGDVYAHRGKAYLASWVGQGCLGKGIRVYDLKNPAKPKHTSTFADSGREKDVAGTWTEKVIVQRVHTKAFHGDLAVVTFQRCDRLSAGFRGFGLYDVTRADQPKRLALYSAPNTRGSHEIWLGSRGGKAFVYTAIIDSELTTSPTYDPATDRATSPGRADFRIIDVSKPTEPRDAGEWGAWRKLGIAVPGRNANFVHSVRVDDNLHRAYLSYWNLGTMILDVKNPAAPKLLGRIPITQEHAHSTYVTHGGRWLVETHETGGGLPYVYDIANPAKPWLLGRMDIPGSADTSVHDPKVRGNHLFFSWYAQGIVVADLRDPTHLTKVAQFMPDSDYLNPDYYCETKCVDVWGVAVADHGLVLASDMNSGLYVFRVKGGFLGLAGAGAAPASSGGLSGAASSVAPAFLAASWLR